MDPKNVKIDITLELLDAGMTAEGMNTLYQVFRDAAKLPGTSDELKGIFQKTSIKCLKLVEEFKHLNIEIASINESLAKLDELLNEIEKKEQ